MTETSEEFRQGVGHRLRRRRRDLKLTVSRVADQIGLTRNTMTNAESGHVCPSVPLLVRLAILYRVSTDWILGLEG